MMARRKEAQEPIRKSFLIFGGVAIGVMLLAFVVMNFVLGGGGAGGGEDLPEPTVAPGVGAPAVVAPTPTPEPTPPPTLRPGGRNPFDNPNVLGPVDDARDDTVALRGVRAAVAGGAAAVLT